MTDWRISGSYFEACNCEAICPCVVFSPPTEDDCIVSLCWRIDKGRHGDTDLDGLNVVMLAAAKGNMKNGDWKAALYVDERASPEQTQALGAIFSGQAGGHFANLAPLIGEVLGLRPAHIELNDEGKRFSMRVGDVISCDGALIEGQGGGDVEVSGHPLAPVPGVAFKIGRSEGFRVGDYGFEVDVAGKNAFRADFAYQA